MRTVPSPAGIAVLAVVVSIALAGGPAEARQCQYVEVVDQCVKRLLVLDVGTAEIESSVALDAGYAGAFAPGGVDFTTVPGSDELYSFVAQGPFLHVIDVTLPYPLATLDAGSEFGLPGIVLNRLDAAEPVTVTRQVDVDAFVVETRYPLYAIGTFANEPWLLILDQEALLAEPLDPGAVLLAAGPLRVDCEECPGLGLDIAAGGPPASSGVQEAYASVQHTADADYRLRIYRIVVHEDFSFDVLLDPWNDEGVSYDGSAFRANGLDFDSTGTLPFGVFQTTSVVKNLFDGESSCTVTGDPTEVAVWGPGSGMEHPNFLFVTAPNPDGSDQLLGFPAGQCPDDGPASLALPVTGLPRALALSSDTSASPWIYTANRYERISAVQVLLSSDSEDGDRIELLESFEITVDGGCPYEVAIRDESYDGCVAFVELPQEPKPPDVDCLADPEDPRCADDDKPNVHISSPSG